MCDIPAMANSLNTLSQFADGHNREVHLSGIARHPREEFADARVGLGSFADFADDIGVQQVHRSAPMILLFAAEVGVLSNVRH